MKKPIIAATCVWGGGYSLALSTPYLAIPWLAMGLAVFAAVGCLMFLFPEKRTLSLLIGLFTLTLLSFSYYQWFDHQNVTKIRIPGVEATALNNTEIQLVGIIDSPVNVDGDQVTFLAVVTEIQISQQTVAPKKEQVSVSIRLLAIQEQANARQWKRGDAISFTGKLQLPSVARNFGGFDYRKYLRQQHIHWIVTLKGTESVQRSRTFHYNWRQFLSWNDDFRGMLAGKLDQMFPENQAGYMKGLLIGLRADLDPQQFKQFSELGLTHILAISGLQIAVFSVVALWIFRKLGLTKERSLLLTICLLPLYILFTGSSPSVVRAGIMGMIALYAALKHKLKDGLQIVCMVGWGMLIWNPYYLLNVSFQLSFFVTIGLIIGVPWMSKLLPLKSPLLNGSVSVALVAQLVSFPMTIYYFNQFSLLSFVANLLLVPLVSFVVSPLGSIVLFLSVISLPIGQWLAWVVIRLNEFTFWVTELLGSLEGFLLIWKSPSLWWIAIYYVLGAWIFWSWVQLLLLRESRAAGVLLHLKSFKARLRPYLISIISGTICAALLLFYGYHREYFQREGTISFLDIGQGDAILIRTPTQQNILVDGGGTIIFRKAGEEWKERKNPYEVGAKLLVPLLKKRGIHQLDYVISTHEDADHIGGLQAVLEQIPVKRIIFNGTLKGNKGVTTFFQTALQRNIPLLTAKESMNLQLDNQTKLHFLFPFGSVDERIISMDANQNDHCLVFLLEMEGTRFLFTADMEKSSEKRVLEHEASLRQVQVQVQVQVQAQPQNLNQLVTPIIDVLKVAHHGSKTSTTEEWLSYWKPKQAVISVGEKNSYGHPAPEILRRLDAYEVEIFRTDQQGEIEMTMTKTGHKTRTKM